MRIPSQGHRGPVCTYVRTTAQTPRCMMLLCSSPSCSINLRSRSSTAAAGSRNGPHRVLRYVRAAHCAMVMAGSKQDLAKQIDDTQKTLARVVEVIDAAHAPEELVPGAAEVAVSALTAREQQLWDRQQALLEREQQRWDAERQAWRDREADLLEELADMRQEIRQLLAAQHRMLLELARPMHTATQPSVASNPPASGVEESGAASSSSGNSSMAPDTPSQAASTGTPAWAQLFEGGGAGGRDTAAGVSSSSSTETPGSAPAKAAGPSFIDSFKAAFAAVDEIDILNQDVDFTRLLQQRAADGAASSPLNTATAARTGSSAQPAQEQAELAVETVKAPPDGPPPVLSVGDDDIYWVSKLHEGLVAAGFHPHDDALESWLFEETTQSALLMYQACNGLDDTGVADEATWALLLGSDAVVTTTTSSSSSISDGSYHRSSTTTMTVEASASSHAAAAGDRTKWPVLMDTDGGREVHVLQLLLGKAGYYCGEDEMRWWMFGDMTAGALKTYQACIGLPESGVCDERTWRALMGPDAVPSDIDTHQAIASSDEFEEDMTSMPAPGAVWLLGEQRWALP